MVNRVLRSALRRTADDEARRRRYREKPVAMGDAKADLTKALRLAAACEGPDAHLAAIAIQHGAILVTFDADYGRFRGLRLERP